MQVIKLPQASLTLYPVINMLLTGQLLCLSNDAHRLPTCKIAQMA